MAERQSDGDGEEEAHHEPGADAGTAGAMIREKEAGENDGEEEEESQEDKSGEVFDEDEGGGKETKAVSKDDRVGEEEEAVRAAGANEVDVKVAEGHGSGDIEM